MTLRIHITHTDLDAAGCDVVFRAAFGPADVLYTVNHDRIDNTVKKAVYKDIGIQATTVANTDSGQGREDIQNALDTHGDIILWVTDIAPNEGTLDILNTLRRHGLFKELFVVDHHPTTEWLGLDKYKEFAVWRKGQCGAWLAYDCGIQRGVFPPVEPGCMSPLREFVNAVDAYDLWKLDSPCRKRGEQLNKLFKFYGHNRFVDAFSRDPFVDRERDMQHLIRIMDEKIQGLIAARIHDLRRAGRAYYEDSDGNRYQLIFDDASDLTSQVGHAALDEFEALDYVVIVRANGVFSLRSREGEVDVSQIAKRHGGGGHPGAAGFKVDTETFYRFLLKALL